MTATIPRVPRQRGVLRPATVWALKNAQKKATAAEGRYREVVIAALEEGSFSAVSEVTGLSTNTLQRWKRVAGA